ncbi:MAG: M23 family metallopeptidase [Candidatus Dojkabacteria bacterium]|nr:M23 family metallopeptidase [Candidatus Dojkabacteria bacterium]MDQ7021622.1 M23 family metallopeptidase [Candidatus Dojkabacteria bacterium]
MDNKNLRIGRVVERNKTSRKEKISMKELEIISEIFTQLKLKVLSRMFWGRGKFYRNFTHLFILITTLAIGLSGLVYKITSNVNATSEGFSANVLGQSDVLDQGGSIETVLLTDPSIGGIKTYKYTVNQDDTLQDIAAKYGITEDTVRWANLRVGSLAFSDKLEPGWELTIPEINGVIYNVKKGDTIDSIIADASVENSEANRFTIVEFNRLTPPYELQGGQTLFIPDGNLKDTRGEGTIDIPKNVFINPLYDPSCDGYIISRGFLSYHNGVDMALGRGCVISAVANGVVTYAGWGSGGQGYYVRLDHGGGIETEYFHGNGTLYVKKGDTVLQGDPLMFMGTTGFSTGTHVHFILWKDKIAINPYDYVPYEPR